MFKVVLKNIHTYKKICNFRRLRKFFVFDLTKLQTIHDEEGFYKAMLPLRMANRITKTTWENRFQELDSRCIQYFPHNTRYKIHDVAVSDGTTSVELFDVLMKNEVDFELFISDKYSKVRQRGHVFKKFYDIEGNLIHADALGMYISPTATPKYFLSKWMSYLFQWKISDMADATELLLLNPKTIDRLKSPNLNFIHYDIFQQSTLDIQFDFVRCMNVLNKKYFSNELIAKAVSCLISTLKDGGVFLVGRTNREGKTHASFFQKEQGHLILLSDFNLGSEIKDIVINSMSD